jgi:hypothetical protein
MAGYQVSVDMSDQERLKAFENFAFDMQTSLAGIIVVGKLEVGL